MREVTLASLKEAARIGARRVATIVHGAGIGGLETGAAAQAVAEGSLLGTYRYTRFKQEPDENAVEELIIAEMAGEKIEAVRQGVAKGRILAESTNLRGGPRQHPQNH